MRFFFCFFFLAISYVYPAEISIALKGDISSSMCQETEVFLEKKEFSKGDQLQLIVQSTTGELRAILALARTIARIRDTYQLLCVTYIQEQCLGPLAILPLLSHRIIVSPIVAWGSIPLQKDIIPSVLEAEIRSLIPADGVRYQERVDFLKGFLNPTSKHFVRTQHELIGKTDLSIASSFPEAKSFTPDREDSRDEKERSKELFDRIQLKADCGLVVFPLRIVVRGFMNQHGCTLRLH